jgi:hypothetical protein
LKKLKNVAKQKELIKWGWHQWQIVWPLVDHTYNMQSMKSAGVCPDPHWQARGEFGDTPADFIDCILYV